MINLYQIFGMISDARNIILETLFKHFFLNLAVKSHTIYKKGL
jgi:hypothetical protein